jgi:hypothetical protein
MGTADTSGHSGQAGRPVLRRREFFRAGLATVSGFHLLPMLQPFNVQAKERVKPRGAAEFCVFLFLNGGAPQLDTWDLKEGRWTPPDFAVRRLPSGILWPHGQFPKLAGQLDRVAIARSTEAWENAHARAQYYMQVGHIFSPPRANEMPSVGSVVAHELASSRNAGDFLPPFVAMNMGAAQAGLIKNGCLPDSTVPLSVNMEQATPFVVPEPERETFARRWRLLQDLEKSGRPATLQHASLREFESYYGSAHSMMTSPGISKVLTLPDKERTRYGSSALGDGCLLAKQLIEANAGTRYILVSHNGWDLHANMYKPDAKNNHYTLCRDLDNALPAFLDDLRGTRTADGRTLFDKTFVVCMGEFGRTGGDLTVNKGRDHNQRAACALFAGAGVKGGNIFGATDDKGEKVVRYDWNEKRSIYPEDVIATIYSQLGIDWTKRITNTPSGRAFEYVEQMSGTDMVNFREISSLFS